MKTINISDELADYIQRITEENELNYSKRVICDAFEDLIYIDPPKDKMNNIVDVLYSYSRLLGIIRKGLNP